MLYVLLLYQGTVPTVWFFCYSLYHQIQNTFRTCCVEEKKPVTLLQSRQVFEISEQNQLKATIIFILRCPRIYNLIICVLDNEADLVPHKFKNYILSCKSIQLGRRKSHVEQEQLTLPEHLRSPPVYNGIRVALSLVFYIMFCRSLFTSLPFFSFGHFLSILLLLTASDNSFGTFKLFLQLAINKYNTLFLNKYASFNLHFCAFQYRVLLKIGMNYTPE